MMQPTSATIQQQQPVTNGGQAPLVSIGAPGPEVVAYGPTNIIDSPDMDYSYRGYYPPPGPPRGPRGYGPPPGAPLPRRFDYMSTGVDREMAGMVDDFWADDGDFRTYGRPPPPQRLPRQQVGPGPLVGNPPPNGYRGRVMGGRAPGGRPPPQQGQIYQGQAQVYQQQQQPQVYQQQQQPQVYQQQQAPVFQQAVQQQAPAVQQQAATTAYAQPQAANQPQNLQPTIIYFDPATGQMTSTTGGQPGAPQVVSVPQGQPQAAAPQVMASNQPQQQQPYSFPQYPGMPNISYGQPAAQPAQQQPMVIPGSAYGGANVYARY
jgi:hypothetical protein